MAAGTCPDSVPVTRSQRVAEVEVGTEAVARVPGPGQDLARLHVLPDFHRRGPLADVIVGREPGAGVLDPDAVLGERGVTGVELGTIVIKPGVDIDDDLAVLDAMDRLVPAEVVLVLLPVAGEGHLLPVDHPKGPDVVGAARGDIVEVPREPGRARSTTPAPDPFQRCLHEVSLGAIDRNAVRQGHAPAIEVDLAVDVERPFAEVVRQGETMVELIERLLAPFDLEHRARVAVQGQPARRVLDLELPLSQGHRLTR